MYKTAKLQIFPLIFSLLISLGAGRLSVWLTGENISIYESINKPPLAPPGFVFPIVWTILYALMGIFSYLIFVSDSPLKKPALFSYAFQLLLNIIWPVIFFSFKNYLGAFFWLIALWIAIIVMIALFAKIRPLAAWLQIPYLIWVTFAGYLTLATALLN